MGKTITTKEATVRTATKTVTPSGVEHMAQLAFTFRDDGPGTIQEKFEAFHAANPDVWRHFVRFARQLRSAGWQRASADLIAQRVRWECYLSGPGDSASPFKLNNNYVSRYARLLEQTYPAEFRGFFEFRRIRTQ